MSIYVDAVSIYCDNCDAKVEIDNLNWSVPETSHNKNKSVAECLNWIDHDAVEMWALNAKEEFGYPHDTVCPTCADEIEEKLWPTPSAQELAKTLREV